MDRDRRELRQHSVCFLTERSLAVVASLSATPPMVSARVSPNWKIFVCFMIQFFPETMLWIDYLAAFGAAAGALPEAGLVVAAGF